MGQDEKLTHQKLSQLWADKKIETLKITGQKYLVMSDIHLGDGGNADDLRHNKNTLIKLLEYYKNKGFKLILLGDIEELWQFDIEEIVNQYQKDIYTKIKEFGKNRVYRVFGNHDLDWHLRDPIQINGHKWAVEALKMRDKDDKACILMIHGHQGSIESDKNSWISRIFVKRIWKPLEPLAVKLRLYGNQAATKSPIAKDYERVVYSWAKKNKIIVICGHSHRAIYASKSYIDTLREKIRDLQKGILANTGNKKIVRENIKEIEKLTKIVASEKLEGREIDPAEKNTSPKPCYFNCGCALYTNGITVLEINNGMIRLVKWHRKPKKDQLFEIYEDGHGQTLDDFLEVVRA